MEDELHQLERQLKQLKLDYEQYFLGNRPREPRQLRDDVHKQIQRRLGTPIRNTALRFRFNSTNSRFQALKRQWDNALRQIECGTYERHIFRANLREPSREPESGRQQVRAPHRMDSLFDDYQAAARRCGQDTRGLTREALESALKRQGAAAKRQLGCDQLDFQIATDGGRVKIKVLRGRD